MIAFPSPMSFKSSISSHMLGYPTLTSSMSTVSSVKPALPRRFETSLVSTRMWDSRQWKVLIDNQPVMGEMWGEIPPSRSTSASWSDVLESSELRGEKICGGFYLSSKRVSPPNIAPRKRPSGCKASLICIITPGGIGWKRFYVALWWHTRKVVHPL